jgi:ankyrin repeat protein
LDPERQTVKFHNAILHNDPEAIKLIVQRRAMNPNHLLLDDSKPVLPIILAAQKAHLESIKALLSLGADVNSQIQAPGLDCYPSSLIAICATEGIEPERVHVIVKLLLDNGADPSRRCVMLTKREQEELDKIMDMLKKQHREDLNIWQLPQAQDWVRQRSALDFAKKHKYTAAAELLSKALLEYHKRGLKSDEKHSLQTDQL